MIDRPSATSVLSVANSASDSCGVSTAVGSSRIKNARAAVERLENFDALALADGQIGDARIGIDGEAELLGNLGQSRSRLAPARERLPQLLGADQYIVEDRQVVGQREVLMHHADAGGQRGGGIARRKRPAEDLDGAGIGDVVTEQDADQRALARAVLAQQREHFAAREIERDVVVGYKRAETLGDAREAEDGLMRHSLDDREVRDAINRGAHLPPSHKGGGGLGRGQKSDTQALACFGYWVAARVHTHAPILAFSRKRGKENEARRVCFCVGDKDRRCRYIDDFGSVSTTSTVNAPSTIAFSFAFAFFATSAGTLLAKVPSGASSEPLYFIVEYLP